MSKLQALAAARKKRAQEEKSNGVSGVEKPMAELSLTDKIHGNKPEATKPTSAVKQPSRGFPLRKRKNSNPHEKALKAPKSTEKLPDGNDHAPLSIPYLDLDQAEPSAFASTMFGSRDRFPINLPANLFTLPYTVTATPATTNPFAGPSPDDVVIAAQSKGSTKFCSN
jgi:elongation factor 1 alpha-like protein